MMLSSAAAAVHNAQLKKTQKQHESPKMAHEGVKKVGDGI